MKLTLLILFFSSSISFGQIFDHIAYKQEVNKAYEMAINKQKYTEALTQLAFVQEKYKMLYGEDYLLKAFCYKSLGDNKLASEAIKTAWTTPTFDLRTLWYIKELDPGALNIGFNPDQLTTVREGLDAYTAPVNQDSLLALFKKLTEEDQFVRDRNSSDPSNETWANAVDSLNKVHEDFFADYVARFGFPGEKQLGTGDFAIWIVFIHTAGNEAYYQKMKPIFLEEVRKGNMSPYYFANWVDQHQFYAKLPSIYNTITANNIKLSTAQMNDVAKNRFEIGLINVPFTLEHH